MDDEPVVLVEAFYQPVLGIVFWYDYPAADGSLVIRARMHDETRMQAFVDAQRLDAVISDHPDFSLN